MSASSKKKLRHAAEAEKLTEKQLAELKEAKKLKIYTTIAVVVLVVLVVFAAFTAISRIIQNSGIRERSTVAATVGQHKISNAELNYFFMDSVNNFYNQYGSYASMFGLDVTKPLDEQVFSEETGTTWADDFLASAIENARATYALVDAANEAGYKLPEEAVANIDVAMSYMDIYATSYGYTDTDSYIKALYGNGASLEGLRDYYEKTELASHYQQHYMSELDYTAEQINTADAADPIRYNAYSYHYYYLNSYNFIESETSDYTDEQKAAGVAAAEAAAKTLTDGITSVEELDAAIAGLEVNADNPNAASYASHDVAYSSINAVFADWVCDASRKAGDITYVANTSTVTDDNGNETEQINGYYVVLFESCGDNNYPLANVRHILVSFEGGSYDSNTGMTTYSDEEKAAAHEAAEAILNEWKNGEATEESFAALANEKSADGDGTTGGLYEDVYPGQMVENFENWCFADRQVGDTGIVETEYGCHVMYYSGDSEISYRNYLIKSELASEEYSNWYEALLDAVTVSDGDTKYVRTDLVLGAS